MSLSTSILLQCSHNGVALTEEIDCEVRVFQVLHDTLEGTCSQNVIQQSGRRVNKTKTRQKKKNTMGGVGV